MNCLLALCLSLGITANSYDTLEPSYSYQVKAGNEIYGWASYEDQTVRLLGQGVAESDIYSFGVGFKHEIKRFFGFIEAGYAITSDTDNDTIRDEIVYTTLVRNHHVKGRPVPAGDPGCDPDARTSYELGNGFIGRVGVGYSIKALKVTAAYRFMSVDEHYELWSQTNRDAGKGWWQESRGRDLSAFELGLWWEF